MRLELMNQLLDCLLAGVILLLDGRTRHSWDPEVNFTATSVLVRSTATSFSVRQSFVVSWRPQCNFDLSTILCGNVGD